MTITKIACGFKRAAMLALTAVMLLTSLTLVSTAKEHEEKWYLAGNWVKFPQNHQDAVYIQDGDILYPGDKIVGIVPNERTPLVRVRAYAYDNTLFSGESFLGCTDLIYQVETYNKKISNKTYDCEIEYVSDAVNNDTVWRVKFDYLEKSINLFPVSLKDLTYVAPIIPIRVPTVQLSRSDVTGYVGKTLDLDYKWFNMTEPKVTWTSSDESVATVDSDGVVTFVAKGKATITLDIEGYGQLKCAVAVKQSGLIKR